jgi:hypothetical protein
MRENGRISGKSQVYLYHRKKGICVSPLMIVTFIWQKLISIEREVTHIATHFWQLFSRIFGETLLIVTHIWRNPT